MNLIQCKSKVNEIISLDKNAGVQDNNRTTKIQAVQPSRHSLAIFTPNAYQSIVGVRHIQAPMGLSVYGGLIEPNKIPFLGNKFSRLVSVVETRQPFLWLAKLTKNTGANMQTLNSILIKLSLFTPLESLILGFILGLPMACLVIGFLSVMGV